MDREKVINGLETIKQFFGYGLPSTAEMFDSYYGILNDAIALLKEQEAVVHCKDCKDACICSEDWVICTHIDSNGNDKHPVDWFCADGEHK